MYFGTAYNNIFFINCYSHFVILTDVRGKAEKSIIQESSG